ncbi:MAG: DNA repair protein RecN [Demequinaceae bacterium]|nr:DNA repair protein RecN [Demequinaceae bacterium]
MLHELSIENLGVIRSARLTLGRGLTVLTGETGAGKTMVLTGLGLVTGQKVAAAVVRTGAEAALAEAVLDVPEDSEAAGVLADAGALYNEDGTITISRSLGSAVRSRTIVGGRQVPQALLADCADDFVTVHGQADQVRLRSGARQREMLDEYAGEDHLAILTRYRTAWAALSAEREELERLERGAEAERTAVSHMRDDLAAIAAVDPQVGEDQTLAAEATLLENAEAVRLGVATAAEALSGEDERAAMVTLEVARKALADAARHDETLAAHEARLLEHSLGLSDLASDLTRYLTELDADPTRLEAVQGRRSELAALCRRVGRDLAGILAYAEEAAVRVAEHDSWDERVEEHRGEVARLEVEVGELAARLSEGRRAVAARLAATVNGELAQLAMPEASFDVGVVATEPGPFGSDAVEMTLAAHPGAPRRPVAEAASGGELSRITLALEVSLAEGTVHEGHSFVFDEVDAGVGGRAAIDVARRLAILARTQQVLVVTHLAQVAAFADHHIVVTKGTDGEVTTSEVREVTGEERVQEIARLLSGQEDSSTARAHALELLEGSTVTR